MLDCGTNQSKNEVPLCLRLDNVFVVSYNSSQTRHDLLGNGARYLRWKPGQHIERDKNLIAQRWLEHLFSYVTME